MIEPLTAFFLMIGAACGGWCACMFWGPRRYAYPTAAELRQYLFDVAGAKTDAEMIRFLREDGRL